MNKIFDEHGNLNPSIKDVKQLLGLCMKNTQEKQKYLMKKYDLEHLKSFTVNQTKETILFHTENDEEFEFDAFPAGIWDSEKNEWLWAWANGGFCEGYRRKAHPMKQLGALLNTEDFTNYHMNCDAHFSQALSCLCVEWLGGKGRFVVPKDQFRIHFIITGVHKENAEAAEETPAQEAPAEENKD